MNQKWRVELVLGVVLSTVLSCKARVPKAPAGVFAVAGSGAETIKCTSDPSRPPVRMTPSSPESTYQRCEVAYKPGKTKAIHLLNLKGTFAEVSWAHGNLMPEEINRGPLGEVSRSVRTILTSDSTLAKLPECLSRRMQESLSKEYLEGLDTFFKGYLKGASERGVAPLFNNSELDKLIFTTSAIGIELENVSDALNHRISDNPLVYNALKNKASGSTLKEILGNLFSPANISQTQQSSADLFAAANEVAEECRETFNGFFAQRVAQFLEGYIPNGPRKYACTGFASPASTSKDGKLLLARNLDADTVRSWNESPTMFLVQEYDKSGNPLIPYVSPGSAGMMFVGGIGGINQAGLTTSLHQMYTQTYRIGYKPGEADIAPFVNQKVLRSARNLDEARAIIDVSNQKHFGAWAVIAGDAKTNEIRSIELSAAGTDQARVRNNKPMVQTNHFWSQKPEIRNAAYTPYFNKYLESRSRFNVLTDAIEKAAGEIDVDFAVTRLANHDDEYEGFRSFGRTAAKAYGVMGNINIPGSRVAANGLGMAASEFWLTLGERHSSGGFLPASHSTFVGFEVNWETLTVQPVGTRRMSGFDAYPGWTESLSIYIDARHAYLARDKEKSLQLLNAAINAAQRDVEGGANLIAQDLPHLPYYFMRARILDDLKRYEEASRDWEFLASKYEFLGDQPWRAYQRALVDLYGSIDRLRLGESWPSAPLKTRLERALKIFSEEGVVAKQYSYADEVDPAPSRHYDLLRKVALTKDILAKGKEGIPAQMPGGIDFVFIE